MYIKIIFVYSHTVYVCWMILFGNLIFVLLFDLVCPLFTFENVKKPLVKAVKSFLPIPRCFLQKHYP